MYRSLVQMAHALLAECVAEGDRVIDATVGRGRDTEILARLVGSGGRVIGFDVQAGALSEARVRLETSGLLDRVELHLASHETLAHWDPSFDGTFAAAIFNLGYLPGSDRSTTTRPDSTRTALDACLRLVGEGGVICVVAYRGHEGAEAEIERVEEWVHGCVTMGCDVQESHMTGARRAGPRLFAVRVARRRNECPGG